MSKIHVIWEREISEALVTAPVGSKWMHTRSGGIYTIVGLTIIESTWELGVVYGDKRRFPLSITRAASEFFDGRFVRQGDH